MLIATNWYNSEWLNLNGDLKYEASLYKQRRSTRLPLFTLFAQKEKNSEEDIIIREQASPNWLPLLCRFARRIGTGWEGKRKENYGYCSGGPLITSLENTLEALRTKLNLIQYIKVSLWSKQNFEVAWKAAKFAIFLIRH